MFVSRVDVNLADQAYQCLHQEQVQDEQMQCFFKHMMCTHHLCDEVACMLTCQMQWLKCLLCQLASHVY